MTKNNIPSFPPIEFTKECKFLSPLLPLSFRYITNKTDAFSLQCKQSFLRSDISVINEQNLIHKYLSH